MPLNLILPIDANNILKKADVYFMFTWLAVINTIF